MTTWETECKTPKLTSIFCKLQVSLGPQVGEGETEQKITETQTVHPPALTISGDRGDQGKDGESTAAGWDQGPNKASLPEFSITCSEEVGDRQPGWEWGRGYESSVRC